MNYEVFCPNGHAEMEQLISETRFANKHWLRGDVEICKKWKTKEEAEKEIDIRKKELFREAIKVMKGSGDKRHVNDDHLRHLYLRLNYRYGERLFCDEFLFKSLEWAGRKN